MVSLSGKWLHPTESFDVSIRDIARHLGRVVRFGGCVDGWWTVLQHSLLVSDLVVVDPVPGRQEFQPWVRDRLALLGLFHDAHEFITGDVPRPWKLDAVSVQQTQIDALIAKSIGLPAFTKEEHELVKIADDLALNVEAHLIATRVVKRFPNKFGTIGDIEPHRDAFRRYYMDSLSGDLAATWHGSGLYVDMFVDRATELLGAIGP
jgi:hypothetical protein